LFFGQNDGNIHHFLSKNLNISIVAILDKSYTAETRKVYMLTFNKKFMIFSLKLLEDTTCLEFIVGN